MNKKSLDNINFDATIEVLLPDNNKIYEDAEVIGPSLTQMYQPGLDPNSQLSYGNRVKSALGLKPGYTMNVVDFGMEIYVYINYTNSTTGRSAGQHFLIKMVNKYGGGTIKSNAGRYRTTTNIDQAISYIRSRANSLQSLTSTQI